MTQSESWCSVRAISLGTVENQSLSKRISIPRFDARDKALTALSPYVGIYPLLRNVARKILNTILHEWEFSTAPRPANSPLLLR